MLTGSRALLGLERGQDVTQDAVVRGGVNTKNQVKLSLALQLLWNLGLWILPQHTKLQWLWDQGRLLVVIPTLAVPSNPGSILHHCG